MKKTLIILMVISLLFIGCGKTAGTAAEPANSPAPAEAEAEEEVVAATPSPSPEPPVPAIEGFKNTEIHDGALSFQIPESFTVPDVPDVGNEFTSYGYILCENGKEYWAEVVVTSNYQIEDPGLTLDELLTLDESNKFYAHGVNTVFERLDSNITAGDAKGLYSKVIYPSGPNIYTDYFYYLYSEGVCYQIIVSVNFNVYLDEEEDIYEDDTISNQILSTVYVDGKKAKKNSEAFEIMHKGNTYFSRRLKGASIEMPQGWHQGESQHLIFDNLVFGLISNDFSMSASVRHFYKNENFNELYDFKMVMITELLNRGAIRGEDIEKIQEQPVVSYDGDTAYLVMFPAPYMLFHIYFEYEDAFYCMEMISHSSDIEAVYDSILSLSTFKAPGKEILPE